VEGDSYPPEFIPRLVDMVITGQLPLEKICKAYPLEKFDEAVDAMRNGRVRCAASEYLTQYKEAKLFSGYQTCHSIHLTHE
jgi:hypothetical protein